MKMLKCWLACVAISGLVLVSGSAFGAGKYDYGASDTEIKLGNTLPYSGPASIYGTIGKCMSGYFEKLNKEQGGINGRKINFISLDDGYSPPKTKEQFRRLVEKEKVLAIIAPLGTPTNMAVIRYINKKKVPHLFVATGATFFDDPEQYPWTIGWQPTYHTESEIYATLIFKNQPNAKIALLYQNDDYGKDFLNGFKAALQKAGKSSMIVAEEAYATTTPTIDSQVISLKASGADVLYSMVTPKFGAQVISKIWQLEWKPAHYMVNPGSNPVAIKSAGPEKADGLITTRYLMDPTDPEHMKKPGMQEWSKFMDEYYPSGSKEQFLNIYGYMSAQTIEYVLRQCGDDLTRANVLKQAENIRNLQMDTSIEGIIINTTPSDHRPMESMEPVRYNGRNQAFESIGSVIKAGNDKNL